MWVAYYAFGAYSEEEIWFGALMLLIGVIAGSISIGMRTIESYAVGFVVVAYFVGWAYSVYFDIDIGVPGRIAAALIAGLAVLWLFGHHPRAELDY